MIASSFFMGISYYFLLALELNVFNILFLLLLMSLIQIYIGYQDIIMHLRSFEKRNGIEVGNIVIFSTLAVIPISYIGALLMNRLELHTL